MRNKAFYDRVHYWDMKINKSLQNKEYKEAVAKDKPKDYFEKYYNGFIEYDLLEFYFDGVPPAEIAECLAFIFEIEPNTKIRAGIYVRIRTEVQCIKQEKLKQVCENVAKKKGVLKDE